METGSIRKSDLEGKYVFGDIDETLAPIVLMTMFQTQMVRTMV